jgi:hypothetical protein
MCINDICIDTDRGIYAYKIRAFDCLNVWILTSDNVWMFETDSTPVIVNGSPVLILDVGYMREAEYIGGNLTNSLEFRYTVRLKGNVNQKCDERNSI